MLCTYAHFAYLTIMKKKISIQMGRRNHGPLTLPVLKQAMGHCRDLRMQSLNNYRRRFNLEPFTSFEDLTGTQGFIQDFLLGVGNFLEQLMLNRWCTKYTLPGGLRPQKFFENDCPEINSGGVLAAKLTAPKFPSLAYKTKAHFITS